MALGDLKVLPDNVAGATPGSGALAWSYGLWVEVQASLPTDIYIYGFMFQNTDASPGADTLRQYLFEIGIGAAGSEVVKLQIPTSSLSDTTAYGYYKDTLKVFLPELFEIPYGTRVAVRVTDSIASAITYNGVKIFYRVGTPTPATYNQILYTSEPPTPNAWNQVKQEAGTGWKKLLYV